MRLTLTGRRLLLSPNSNFVAVANFGVQIKYKHITGSINSLSTLSLARLNDYSRLGEKLVRFSILSSSTTETKEKALFPRSNSCSGRTVLRKRGPVSFQILSRELSTCGALGSSKPLKAAKKGLPENWGSKKKDARYKPIKLVYEMATDENVEVILAPLRAAVKEQVRNLNLTPPPPPSILNLLI